MRKVLCCKDGSKKLIEMFLGAVSAKEGDVMEELTVDDLKNLGIGSDDMITDQNIGFMAKMDSGANEITLCKYIGSEPDVVVANQYDVDGTMYTTKLPDNSSGMFANNETLQSVAFAEGIDTSNVTDMSYMFANDPALKTVDLYNIDNSNVVTMEGMFENDTALEKVTVDKTIWKEEGVNVNNMFNNAGVNEVSGDLTPTSLDHWFYSIIEHPSDAYPEPIICLTKLKSSAPAEVVVPATYEIDGVTYLTKLGNATNNPPMQFGKLYLNDDETKYTNNYYTERIIFEDGVKINNMKDMFRDCHNLEYVKFGKPAGNIYPAVSTMENAFYNCENLKDVIGLGNYSFYEMVTDYGTYGTPMLTNLFATFADCTSIESIDLTDLAISTSATTMGSMFSGCTNLKQILVSKRITLSNGNEILGFNIPSKCDTTDMFKNCGVDHVTFVE